MSADFNLSAKLFVKGLAAMLKDPRHFAESVGNAALRADRRLGVRGRSLLHHELDRLQDAQRIAWEEELRIERTAAEMDQLPKWLADGFGVEFDGVELLVFRRFGGAETLAAAALDRLARPGAELMSPQGRGYALEFLASSIEAASHALARPASSWATNDSLEDEEIEPARSTAEMDREADEGMPRDLLTDMRYFLKASPDVTAERLAAYLRVRLRKHLQERAETRARFEAAGLTDGQSFSRALGASEEVLHWIEVKNQLWEALQQMPPAERAERLLFRCDVETELLALTWRYRDLVPQDRQGTLADYLRAGMERRHALARRISAIRYGAPYATLLAGPPLEVGDFEGAEAAIRGVEESIADGFVFSKPVASDFRGGSPRRDFLGEALHSIKRQEMMEERDPIRRARAMSLSAQTLMTDADEPDCDVPDTVQEAMSLWSEAARIWTRDAHPRKWAALMHNIGVALETLGVHEGKFERHRSALAQFDAALDALDPDREPWTFASIWANRLDLKACQPDQA